MNRHAQGFTLIEALISVFILMFGLMGVAQLWTAAATSTSTANRATAATAAASQAMERLMSQHYNTLVSGNGSEYVTGVGEVQTTWTVTPVLMGDPAMVCIRVTAVVPGPFQRLSTAEFVTYRTMLDVPPIPDDFVPGPPPGT